ncbi:hypothetical protein C1646_776891 [Rhizophagus diaphanus]|nr:hypothetical protein C1646_776891 [Rhizophagus diaphanus] [Rhizophagus sp. MUCL 43196]
MSETSTPYTPASTSTSVAGNETVSLADDIRKYDTTKLIDFLRGEKDLGLDDDDLEIIRKRKINGRAFLKTSKEDFERYGLEGGPATNLADFAKECKEKKLRAFSSYRSLEEVLGKYGIKSNSITSIPQFEPATHPVDENSAEFKLCIDDILRRIKNMGPVVDNNEAMRCEYISTILHTAVSLLGGLIISPQLTIIGTESSGRVDYAIKKTLDELLEEIICITEGKQNQPGKGTNLDMLKKKRKADEAFESDYEYVYDALEDPTELRKNVKRILEVIVGLLKDRVSASDEPASKKRRVEEKIKIKIQK